MGHERALPDRARRRARRGVARNRSKRRFGGPPRRTAWGWLEENGYWQMKVVVLHADFTNCLVAPLQLQQAPATLALFICTHAA